MKRNTDFFVTILFPLIILVDVDTDRTFAWGW